jgi:prepilin-type N-terminal cleavage/methylation domain-containing protein
VTLDLARVSREAYVHPEPLAGLLSSAGAEVRGARGFTLIELLLVIVIVGILVTVLIPRWASTRERAFVAALKSDLRNLATAEESYFYDNASYATSLASLVAFTPSTGNLVTINEATVGGWSATAARPGVTKQCSLFVGNVAPVGAATIEGQIACQ